MPRTHTKIHNAQLRDTLKAEGLRQIAFAPLAADDNWFKTSTAPTAGNNKTTTLLAASMTSAYCPGWPTVPVIVVTDSTGDDITAVSIAIIGVDQYGDYCTETVTATNSSGTWTGTAVNAYRTLVSAAITCTGTVDSADRYIIGFDKTFGLGCHIDASADVVCHLWNGAFDDGTVGVAYGTYTVAGTTDASGELVLCVCRSFYS